MSNQKKVIYVGLALVLTYILAYVFSISSTFDLWQQTAWLKEQLQVAASAPEKNKIIEHQLQKLDGLVKQSAASEDFQTEVLGTVSRYCRSNKVTLVSFPLKKDFNKESYRLTVCSFIVEGGFSKLLDLLYLFENDKLAKVASVRFYSDVKQKHAKLYMEMYVQELRLIE